MYPIERCFQESFDLFMHIWSDYGDEIVVDKGQKLTKWGPAGRVSQRLSMKERGTKVIKKKKKKKKGSKMSASSEQEAESAKNKPKSLYSRESEAQIMLQAMAHNEKEEEDKEGYRFVPTGPGKGINFRPILGLFD